MPEEEKNNVTRREFIRGGVRGAALLSLGGGVGLLASRSQKNDTLWQLDPYKCIACTKCATECVLEVSAVKVVRSFDMCGYCEICPGYFKPEANAFNTAAENQNCPTGAIKRRFVEEPYYEYTIDESLCIGCAICVKGCNAFGNGSLYLQVRHDRCLNCNNCPIASACPADAFRRVPSNKPSLLTGTDETF